GPGRLRLGGWNGVERDLEGDDRPLGVERLACARVQLSKPAHDGFRPELEGRRAARMKERRAAGDDLDRIRVNAERRKKRHRVALGVEDVDQPAAVPVPAVLAGLGAAATQSGSRNALVIFALAEKDLADL